MSEADTKVAQSLLEKGIAWAFTVPAWLSLLIAAAVTAWLIWWAWRPVPTPITSTSTSAEADLIKQQRLAAKGALIVRPVEKKKFDLDTLLSGITAENIHAETSTGPSVGNESHAGAISAIASANAPFIYIDGVPNYGVNHGVMNLTLEALRFQPGGQAGVLVDRVIVAHLRMSLPAAESLRAAIDAAFALVHPKPEQVN